MNNAMILDAGDATATTLLLPPQLVALIAAEARDDAGSAEAVAQLPPRLQCIFRLEHGEDTGVQNRVASARGAAAEAATATGLAGAHHSERGGAGPHRSALPQSLEDGAVHWGVRV